jgi:hypothetical protein
MSSSRIGQRWLLFALVFLVLLNVATLSYVLFRDGKGTTGQPAAPPPGTGPESVSAFLANELGFTREQKLQLDRLRADHFAETQMLRENLRDLHEAFFSSWRPEDAAKADSIGDAIGRKQAALELATHVHFRKIREICDPDQKERFDGIIGELLRRVGPPPPERGPHPPGK